METILLVIARASITLMKVVERPTRRSKYGRATTNFQQASTTLSTIDWPSSAAIFDRPLGHTIFHS